MDEEVILVLRVSNAATAMSWYQRLGFSQEWEYRFEPGFPAFVSAARCRVRLFLSEHTGDARPDTLIYLRLRDLEASRRNRRGRRADALGAGGLAP
jgi:Glyoxalase superfamily protein